MGVVGLSCHVNHCSQSSYLCNIYMFYYIIPFCATSSHLWNNYTNTLSTFNSSLLLVCSLTAEEYLQIAMFGSCLTYSCVRLHVYTPSCVRLHVYTPSCVRLHVYTFLFTSSCGYHIQYFSVYIYLVNHRRSPHTCTAHTSHCHRQHVNVLCIICIMYV